MPDTQFIAVILLLVAAVAFGYFYLKRAQGRDHAPTTAEGREPSESDAAGGAPDRS